MMKQKKCEAKQYSCETVCNRCNMSWDTNDPHPPRCKTGLELFKYTKERIKWLNKKK